MNDVLGHDSALQGYIGPETTWANEMNFIMNQHRSLDKVCCTWMDGSRDMGQKI